MENPELQNTNLSEIKILELSQNQKPSNKPKVFFIGFLTLSVLVAFIVGGFILGSKGKFSKEKPCPAVARICNDGSTAKLGHNCFQTCPEDSISPSPISSDETANPDQIGANWKTYTNKEYGFEFKYPSDLKLTQDKNGVFVTENEPPSFIMTCRKFSFAVDYKTNLQITSEFYDFKIADRTGKRLDKIYSLEGKICENSNIIIATPENSKTKSLQISLDHQKDEYKEVFDQILQTFKFTR